jgi:hypothetical protein
LTNYRIVINAELAVDLTKCESGRSKCLIISSICIVRHKNVLLIGFMLATSLRYEIRYKGDGDLKLGRNN